MLLNERTTVFVTSRDGTSRMTLSRLIDSLRGGTRWCDIEVATELSESKQLETKRLGMGELMRNMTPQQVIDAVDLVQANEKLMTLSDEHS